MDREHELRTAVLQARSDELQEQLAEYSDIYERYEDVKRKNRELYNEVRVWHGWWRLVRGQLAAGGMGGMGAATAVCMAGWCTCHVSWHTTAAHWPLQHWTSCLHAAETMHPAFMPYHTLTAHYFPLSTSTSHRSRT